MKFLLKDNMMQFLQEKYQREDLAGYIIKSYDQWLNHSSLLEKISGFSGSNGLLIVTDKEKLFFTDSRYLVQAKLELSEDTTILDSYDPASSKVLAGLKGKKLGLDPKLFTDKEINYFEKHGITIVEKTLFADEVPENSSIFELDLSIVGLTQEEKIQLVLKKLPPELDYLIINSPASFNWLLNLRGKDLPHSPFLLGYAVLDCKKASIKLFANSKDKVSGIEIAAISALEASLDLNKTYAVTYPTRYFTQKIPKLLKIVDPILAIKAIKNPAEIEGMRKAQEADSLAFKKFILWLEEVKNNTQSLDELTIVEKIYQCRKEDPTFMSESFATIAGYGSNSAIVHYHPTEKSNKNCLGEIPILLLDSGGQYYSGGTTDITRVFALGEVPERVKELYTDLLKGHLALASAIFPRGTNGAQLEVLARYFLWKQGLDYGHGTGHGVGHFSAVHEGPQALSRHNDVPLEVGMIVSIEPGYYEEGAFGLRIENLYLVQEAPNNFLTFEPLTKVPLDSQLIDFNRLTEEEKTLLQKIFPPS